MQIVLQQLYCRGAMINLGDLSLLTLLRINIKPDEVMNYQGDVY